MLLVGASFVVVDGGSIVDKLLEAYHDAGAVGRLSKGDCVVRSSIDTERTVSSRRT